MNQQHFAVGQVWERDGKRREITGVRKHLGNTMIEYRGVTGVRRYSWGHAFQTWASKATLVESKPCR